MGGASVQANFDRAPPFQPCVRKPQAANEQLLRDPSWVKKGCAQAARSGDPGIALGRRAAAAVRGAEIRGSLLFLPLRTRGKKKLPPPTLNRPPTLLTLRPIQTPSSQTITSCIFPPFVINSDNKKTQPSSSSSSNVRFLFAPLLPPPPPYSPVLIRSITPLFLNSKQLPYALRRGRKKGGCALFETTFLLPPSRAAKTRHDDTTERCLECRGMGGGG